MHYLTNGKSQVTLKCACLNKLVLHYILYMIGINQSDYVDIILHFTRSDQVASLLLTINQIIQLLFSCF